MLVKAVNYVNITVHQLPNLMATRFTNGFEDRPREEKLISTGIESLDYLPLHWVGSLNMEVTYRDRREVEDKDVKVEKKGNGVGGLMTTGEFGPVLSTVLADALKGKITWAHWEKSIDRAMAVFHYQFQRTSRIITYSSVALLRVMARMVRRNRQYSMSARLITATLSSNRRMARTGC